MIQLTPLGKKLVIGLAALLATLFAIIGALAWWHNAQQPRGAQHPPVNATSKPAQSQQAQATATAKQTATISIKRKKTQAQTGPVNAAGNRPASNAPQDTGSPVSDEDDEIIITLTQDATAAATVAKDEVRAQQLSPFGVTCGFFPGWVALDYQVWHVSVADDFPLDGLRGNMIGVSILANHKILGVGVNYANPWLHPRLYFEAGYIQPLQLEIAPWQFVGCGYRF